jgi:phosphoribosyl 1,2-cyclic phosphodiesterase
MQLSTLGSGSKGNSTYLKIGEYKFLIDVGFSCPELTRRLKKINIDIGDINFIFITHTHNDHILGLKQIVKKHNPTVFLTKKMYDELENILDINNIYIIEDDFGIDDIKINIFKTSHDSSESLGYVFNYKENKLAYITDTGYINRRNYPLLENCTYYIIESNYDVKMLMDGSYPYYLKQRILSDKGHLSNEQCNKYLSKFITKNTIGITLIHLSEENNTEEIALNNLNKMLKKENTDLKYIIVSKQEEVTELINLD